MKKIVVTCLAVITVVVACKSKKATATTSTDPTNEQLKAVQTSMPDATMADLKAGHAIYFNQCTQCHKAKDVTGYTEDKLQHEVDVMSKKAKLSDSEKAAVWKYALGVNRAAKNKS